MTRATRLRGSAATLRSAAADVAAKPGAFVSQMVVMAINDIVWVVFWTLFFHRAGTLRGWDTHRVLLLFSVITTGAGIALGLLANARRIAVLAVDGQLDAVLALPVPPLRHLLLSRIEPTNLGDFAFGVTLFAFVGHPTPLRVFEFVLVAAASATIVTSFLVLAGSTAFFMRRGEAGELGFHAIILLSSYPVDLFAGAAKLMLYTVVPAAFVSSVPVRLLTSFDARNATLLATVAVGFAAAAWLTFAAGLRRYTSGAVWTRA